MFNTKGKAIEEEEEWDVLATETSWEKNKNKTFFRHSCSPKNNRIIPASSGHSYFSLNPEMVTFMLLRRGGKSQNEAAV